MYYLVISNEFSAASSASELVIYLAKAAMGGCKLAPDLESSILLKLDSTNSSIITEF
jgi:hypothetical protein